jgi:hypothetical protein
MGEPLTPSHFRVMVKLSRTLNPGGIDLAGGLRVQEEDSVLNIIRSPYCPAMSLP